MSREKLLFTHKPLAMQNNCAPAESYQNLIRRGRVKPKNHWLNSDKELITYQLLADGFRGAYGQIPSDFQKEVRRDSLYPPSKYNFIEIG